MTHYVLQRSIYVINVDILSHKSVTYCVINVDILSHKSVTYCVMFERSMTAFGDVVDAHQPSIMRPITSTIRKFVNFMLVVRDLRKDRLVVGVDQKRNAC